MKRKMMFALVFAFGAVACNNTDRSLSGRSQTDTLPGSGKSNLSVQDSGFLSGWNRYANKKSGFKSIKDFPIDAGLARQCMDEYTRTLGANPPNMTGVKFTDWVLFNTEAFRNWILTYQVFDQSQQIIIEFGIYTQAVFDALRNDTIPENDIPEDHVGRITAFISPYDAPGQRSRTSSGALIHPYNLGSLHP